MSGKQRHVEHFDDGHASFGTMLVFTTEASRDTGKVYHVDFEIHEIITDPPSYEIFGFIGSGDWTENLEEACPQVRGTVKWDGCSHAYFGNRKDPAAESDGYLHLCGQSMWLWLSKVMPHVFDRCREILLAAGTWDKSQGA